MSVKDEDKRLASYVSFITFFRYAERFFKISRSSRKKVCSNSWFRLKIIVVGRLSIHIFIYIYFESSQNLNKSPRGVL